MFVACGSHSTELVFIVRNTFLYAEWISAKMGNKALRLEVSKLRTLVKKTRTNIIRKLLRDRKFWAGKVETNNSNRRASKKLEAAEALSKHIKSLRTSQLVKDVIRFQLRKDAAGDKQQLTAVADRAIARFYAEPKVLASVRVLVDRFELQKNESLIDVAVKDGQKETKDSPSEAKGRKKKKKTKPNRAKGEKATPKVDKLGKQKATKKSKNKPKDEDEDEDELSDTYDNEEASDVSVSMSEDEDSMLDDDEEEEEEEKDETPSKPTKKAPEPKPKQAEKERKKKEPKLKLKTPANLKPPEDDDEEEGCLMVQDSFFVTESGTNYVAVAPVLKKSEEGDSDGERTDDEEEEESWKFSVKRRKKQEQRNAAQGKLPDGGNSSRNGKFESNKRSFAPSSEPTKRFRRDSGQTEPDPGLHPSWAAKQRQKGIIPFAGKKVVFDDEGVQPATSEPTKAKEVLHPSWAAKQAQKGIKPFAGKKVVFDDGESTSVPSTKPSSADDLHPSWAAKQAQKGIKPFTGKKIVFQGVDTNATSDLHPSWAAKQAQKGIKPFAGKKKVFDDNDGGEGNRQQDRRRGENMTNTEGLHPSWVAKQAQKGLKPFAGKKITFGDDENATSVNGNRSNSGSRAAAKTQQAAINDLHPSWAAKQAQKGIKQFEGKKISFDV
ncbi:uncharacterized protein DDB_G0286299-like isoform X2 [Anopheles albimanus]|uniref:uncharacterized protein DDB_G0286299-like isoform X2 n=1 Tax=Anopheles albimanus TaxID=7167 RepID=UPI00163E49F5|nr:uncharacterized protein DDB_G0286299-like isoform X2 [Anopheles albimanus]